MGHAFFAYAAVDTWARHYDRRHPHFAVELHQRDGDTVSVEDGYFAICLKTNPYTFLGSGPSTWPRAPVSTRRSAWRCSGRSARSTSWAWWRRHCGAAEASAAWEGDRRPRCGAGDGTALLPGSVPGRRRLPRRYRPSGVPMGAGPPPAWSSRRPLTWDFPSFLGSRSLAFARPALYAVETLR